MLRMQLGAMEGVPGVLIYMLQQLKEKLGVVDTKVQHVLPSHCLLWHPLTWPHSQCSVTPRNGRDPLSIPAQEGPLRILDAALSQHSMERAVQIAVGKVAPGFACKRTLVACVWAHKCAWPTFMGGADRM